MSIYGKVIPLMKTRRQGREEVKDFLKSPVAYLYDTSDWKNQCIGLHQPGDPGWLMYHYAG